MRFNRLLGRDRVKLTLETVSNRSTPATPLPALVKAERTESSSPNNRKAATTDSNVNRVRVLRRNRADHTRWKYFMRPRSRDAQPTFPYPGATYAAHTPPPSDRASP